MPDAPPGGDYQHASVGREAGKNACAQHQRQSQAGVLDTRFDGEGAAVPERDFGQRSHAEADSQGHQVMDEHYQEDVFDTEQEGVDVAAEREHHHGKENEDGEPLEGLF